MTKGVDGGWWKKTATLARKTVKGYNDNKEKIRMKKAKMIQEAIRIRMIEEKIVEIYDSDAIQSPVHLSIGQEAVAVGVCNGIQKSDKLFINYRGHAYYLARGGPLKDFFAELMGKATGISKGKAGSMHLACPEVNVMGASAVVGSTISHAVGASLADKIRANQNAVHVAVFGDGAMEQGVFFESLNFASLKDLNVLFICEDNGLAVHASMNERQAFDLRKVAKSFNIDYYNIEQGWNPYVVKRSVEKARKKTWKNTRPAIIRIKTYRYKEHVGPGDDFKCGYRDERELNEWKRKDPIINCWDNEQKYREEVKKEINDALEYAYNSPVPTKEELLKDVL